MVLQPIVDGDQRPIIFTSQVAANLRETNGKDRVDEACRTPVVLRIGKCAFTDRLYLAAVVENASIFGPSQRF